jgi:thiamine biosynthesis lipoprotein
MALATRAAAMADGLMPFSRLLALFCASLWVVACTDARPRTETFYVFGTLVEVSLADTEAANAQAAFQELQQLFQGMHHDLHAWEPGKLDALNQAIAQGRQGEADRHIANLVLESQPLETASGGRFNPAIGKLVGLWGFHTSDYPIRQPMPDASAIAALLQMHPSSLDIDLQPASDGLWQASSSNQAVQLDFGGIAKGYAVDQAIDLLRRKGIDHAIVNAGGDLRAIGSNSGSNWRIAIENPLGGVIGILEIDTDEAVFTSGNYQRFGVDQHGFRYAHILDPRTGQPVVDVMSATVVMANGTRADAAATALVVAGRKEWREVARGMGIDQLLLTTEDGTVYLTRALDARIQAAADTRQKFVLLD